VIEIIEGILGFEIRSIPGLFFLGGGGSIQNNLKIRVSARASQPRSSANKVQQNLLLKLYFSSYIIQSFTKIFKAGKIGMGYFWARKCSGF